MNIVNGRLRAAAYGAGMLVTLGEPDRLEAREQVLFDEKLQTAVDGREGNPLPARLQRQKYIHCGQRGCRLADASIDGFSLLRHMHFYPCPAEQPKLLYCYHSLAPFPSSQNLKRSSFFLYNLSR